MAGRQAMVCRPWWWSTHEEAGKHAGAPPHTVIVHTYACMCMHRARGQSRTMREHSKLGEDGAGRGNRSRAMHVPSSWRMTEESERAHGRHLPGEDGVACPAGGVAGRPAKAAADQRKRSIEPRIDSSTFCKNSIFITIFFYSYHPSSS